MTIRSTSSQSQYRTTVFGDVALLILRWVVAGTLIYGHGAVKITHIIHGNYAFMDPIGIGAVPSLFLAAFAEGICAFFVAIGLYTRAAAAILVINFLVAFFTAWDQGALLYLGVFIAILLAGSGKYSLDQLWK